MIITPKTRGFICTTAHPTGCAKAVQNQINYIQSQVSPQSTPSSNSNKNILIIGASTGYGLATRIAATFGLNANTIGVMYEKPSNGKRTASAGWYNTAAFEAQAHKAGHYAKTINGDAFSTAIKTQTRQLLKQDLGQKSQKLDCVIYSLASPRRTDPLTGETYHSVLKPTHTTFNSKTLNVATQQISDISIEPATKAEVDATVKVMGGEDWQQWIDALIADDLLAENAITLAYSYLGPALTYPIYHQGSIGQAKKHLAETAIQLNQKLQAHCRGRALISVNKGLVTQSSSAIPVVPLYISLLYQVMKEKNCHEGCIEQMWRLLRNYDQWQLDKQGMIRLDDFEMQADVQNEVSSRWGKVTNENLSQLADISGYEAAFYELFGFDQETLETHEDVNPVVDIASLSSIAQALQSSHKCPEDLWNEDIADSPPQERNIL